MTSETRFLDDVDLCLTNIFDPAGTLESFLQLKDRIQAKEGGEDLYTKHEKIILCLAIKNRAFEVVKFIVEGNPGIASYDWTSIGNTRIRSSDKSIRDIDPIVRYEIHQHPIALAFDNNGPEIGFYLKNMGFPHSVRIESESACVHSIQSILSFLERTGSGPDALNYLEFLNDEMSEDCLLWFESKQSSHQLKDICNMFFEPIYERVKGGDSDREKYIVEMIERTKSIFYIDILPLCFLKKASDSLFLHSDIPNVSKDHFASDHGDGHSIQRMYLELFNCETDELTSVGRLRMDCFEETLSRGDPDIYMGYGFLELMLSIADKECVELVLKYTKEKQQSDLDAMVNQGVKTTYYEWRDENIGLVKSFLLNQRIIDATKAKPIIRKRVSKTI